MPLEKRTPKSRFARVAYSALLTALTLIASAPLFAKEVELSSVYRLLDHKNYSAAADKLSGLVQKHPENADVWYQYGVALYRDGQLDESIAASKKAATFEGYARYAHFNSGLAYAALGELKQAWFHIEKSMEQGYINPDQWSQEKDLAAFRSQGKFPLATKSHYEILKAKNRIEVPYHILLPENYEPSKRYRALLAFPPGNMGSASADWAIETLWARGKGNTDWIIVIPVAPENGWMNHPSHHALNDLMEHVRDHYAIEDNRFRFLGFQSGSRPASSFSVMSRNFVHSLTTVGAMNWEDWNTRSMREFKGLPVTLIAAEGDAPAMGINETAFRALKQQQANVRFNRLFGEGAKMESLYNNNLLGIIE